MTGVGQAMRLNALRSCLRYGTVRYGTAGLQRGTGRDDEKEGYGTVYGSKCGLRRGVRESRGKGEEWTKTGDGNGMGEVGD